MDIREIQCVTPNDEWGYYNVCVFQYIVKLLEWSPLSFISVFSLYHSECTCFMF